jgi:hypothetical protein
MFNCAIQLWCLQANVSREEVERMEAVYELARQQTEEIRSATVPFSSLC